SLTQLSEKEKEMTIQRNVIEDEMIRLQEAYQETLTYQEQKKNYESWQSQWNGLETNLKRMEHEYEHVHGQWVEASQACIERDKMKSLKNMNELQSQLDALEEPQPEQPLLT